MKSVYVFLLANLLYIFSTSAEVEVYTIDKQSGTNMILRANLFKKELEKAIKRIDTSGEDKHAYVRGQELAPLTIVIVVRATNELKHPAMTYRGIDSPFIKSGKEYDIHTNPSLLEEDVIRLEHVAHHELIHIKNGDPGRTRDDVDETELERRTEYEVYKLVGWDRYLEYLKYTYSKTDKKERLGSEEAFIESFKRYLGISTDFKNLAPSPITLTKP